MAVSLSLCRAFVDAFVYTLLLYSLLQHTCRIATAGLAPNTRMSTCVSVADTYFYITKEAEEKRYKYTKTFTIRTHMRRTILVRTL